MKCQPFVVPSRKYDVNIFVEPRSRLVGLDAKHSHFSFIKSPASTPIDAPAAEVIEQRDLFGESKRMVKSG